MPSLVGGIVGAVLLVMTPTAVFDRLIPLLILFATVLFMLQEPVQRADQDDGEGACGIDELADRRAAVSVSRRRSTAATSAQASAF